MKGQLKAFLHLIILKLMNKKKNNSVARKLTLRMLAVLAAGFMVLIGGAFLSLVSMVKMDAESYAKSLAGIYADLAIYEAHNQDRPIDMTFNDRLSFFGEYMCTWYRVGFIYSYIPDFESQTIKYIAVTSKNREDGSISTKVGEVEEYILTEAEMKVWDGSELFSVEKSDWIGNGMDVTTLISDDFGNKTMLGVTVSISELMKEMRHGFLMTIAFLLMISVLLAVLMRFFIQRKVSDPAKRISMKMSDYVTGKEHSKIAVNPGDSEEFTMIVDSFNQMTEDLDNYINDIARLGREQERQQAEVDIASAIQKGILPYEEASFANCDIKAVMKPAKDIGGDLYDYLELDSTHTMIVVADVSGKGIASAMLMALVLAHIRQLAKLRYTPSAILKNINDTFAEENPKMMFVTAFVGIYDSESGKLTYANAGHNPPYLIHNGIHILDESDGTPLGLFSGEDFVDVVVDMEVGDSVFLYTDGVNEAVNESGEFYGVDRIVDTLDETSSSLSKDYIGVMESSVREFAGNAEQNDDITMLALYAKENPVLYLDYDVKEFAKIRERLFASNLPKQLLMDLCVAAEECFVNICSYAFDGPAPEGEKIQFYFEYSNKVIIRFSDGGRMFDPRSNMIDINEYDIDTEVGGLGRLIAFSIADSVDYEYKDGRNILTITKTIKK